MLLPRMAFNCKKPRKSQYDWHQLRGRTIAGAGTNYPRFSQGGLWPGQTGGGCSKTVAIARHRSSP